MARRATTRAVAQAAQLGGLRVAIYIRRSTDEEHQPYTLEAQRTKLDAYVTSQPGWRLVAVYSDDASGAKLDRPGLQAALAAARAGQFDVLLVYRVDRFTRRIRDLAYLIEELDRVNVAFRSATEAFDTATPAGRMMLQILAVFAQFERDVLIDRVINGMERKAAAGRWTVSRPPYGYAVDPTDHVLLRDGDEAPVVAEIFRLYTYRRLGTRAIAGQLNQRGLRRRSAIAWSHKTVADILVNRVYLGEIHFRDIVVDHAHAALVEPETFAEAQRILAIRGENPARKAAAFSDYHLTGKVTCPRCGRHYVGTNATGRSRVYRYYTCTTRSNYGVTHCPAPRIDADTLDTARSWSAWPSTAPAAACSPRRSPRSATTTEPPGPRTSTNSPWSPGSWPPRTAPSTSTSATSKPTRSPNGCCSGDSSTSTTRSNSCGTAATRCDSPSMSNQPPPTNTTSPGSPTSCSPSFGQPIYPSGKPCARPSSRRCRWAAMAWPHPCCEAAPRSLRVSGQRGVAGPASGSRLTPRPSTRPRSTATVTHRPGRCGRAWCRRAGPTRPGRPTPAAAG